LNGRRCNITNPVSHIDMIPTLLDLLGDENNRSFPGRSLGPLIHGNLDAQRDVHIEWNPNSGALKVKKGGTKLASKIEQKRIQSEHSRAIVTHDGWKLCLSDVDKSQLFNLREDPGETVNLFDSGRHKDIILKLTKKIHRWQDQVKDIVEV